MPASYPPVVVFDLDYTLWPSWCDTHVRPPVRPFLDGLQVVDADGEHLAFYPDVALILAELRAAGVKIVAALRTATPKLARQILTHLEVHDPVAGARVPAVRLFDSLQWGQGLKIKHIERACADLGAAPADCVLFDDEGRNRDVQRIGVEFCEVTSWLEGLSRRVFERGIAQWVQARSSAAAETV